MLPELKLPPPRSPYSIDIFTRLATTTPHYRICTTAPCQKEPRDSILGEYVSQIARILTSPIDLANIGRAAPHRGADFHMPQRKSAAFRRRRRAAAANERPCATGGIGHGR